MITGSSSFRFGFFPRNSNMHPITTAVSQFTVIGFTAASTLKVFGDTWSKFFKNMKVETKIFRQFLTTQPVLICYKSSIETPE